MPSPSPTNPDQQELKALTHRLPEVLSLMHQRADALREALCALDGSPRTWESYLLQPAFAREAAQLLDGDFEHPFRLASSLFALLDYAPGTELFDARQTLQIPGLLCVPDNVIQHAKSLNEAKADFQQLTSAIKLCLADRPVPERDSQLRDALAGAGHPRTHLRQSYRQILICPQKPDALALSWIKARKSIRKVTVDWCEKKLVQLDPLGQDPGIQYQRQLLAGLHPSQHAQLRQIQVQSRPNLQVAEVFYEDSESGGETYHQVGYSAMPILIEGADNGRLPEFSRVDNEPPASRRRQRKDLKISSDPLLPSLRVHLYTPDKSRQS